MLSNNRYYRRTVKDVESGFTYLNSGFMRKTFLSSMRALIYRLETGMVRNACLTDEIYKDNRVYQPTLCRSTTDLEADFQERLEHIQNEYGTGNTEPIVKEIIETMMSVRSTSTTIQTLKSMKKCIKLVNQIDHFISNCISYVNFSTRSGKIVLLIDLSNDDVSVLKYDCLDKSQFINLASQLMQQVRHENRKPTIDEYVAQQVGFQMVTFHGDVNAPIVPWGNSGFRKIQTQASITDPGYGHLTGTVNKMSYLIGTNVHVEFLERGAENNREKVEPYRLPDLATIGKIKMAVGTDTSVSSYVGRPMFENSFDDSFIKTVHTTIGVCSAIFMNGLSECKIAIERMTVTQAIKFMRAVSANVVRDEDLQILAAAFCINYPLTDDRPETKSRNHGHPKIIRDRMEIAKLGIQIAKSGHFDKVTFDGTANWYPSDPIMTQLGYKNALTLVHTAHSIGLITYFSAGFRFKNLPDIVLSGTDGIGLGGAQILRFMDKENGNQGPFKSENIEKILNINQKTAQSILGQGSILLCRLDQMYFELSLPIKFEAMRDELFKALLVKDIRTVSRLFKQAREITELPIDLVHPLSAWASRLIDNKDSCNAFRDIAIPDKNEIVKSLDTNMRNHDYGQLHDILYELKMNHVSEKTMRLIS